MRIVTAKQMKTIEQASDTNGVSFSQLMLNAGTRLGEEIEKHTGDEKRKHVFFLCGSGNNGGDCFVAARYLHGHGVPVTIGLACGMPGTEISKAEFNKIDGISVYEDTERIRNEIMKADIVVDGVFGTGFHGELDTKISSFLNLNKKALRVAVDIPSGGNSVTGGVSDGCFRADYTVTFGFKKIGMTQYPLKEYCGKIISADIGIPVGCTDTDGYLCEEIDDTVLSGILKPRNADSHKGTYGTLLCVTGSRTMPGAGILSAEAALRCGCGIVKCCCVPENISSIASRIPELVFVGMASDEEGFYLKKNSENLIGIASKAKAVLIGCGLGVTLETKNLVCKLITSVHCPIILDADGINCICDCIDIIKEAKSKIILTPHPAEMARLMKCSTSEIQADRHRACVEFLSFCPDAVLVLKGAGTIVAGTGKMYVNTTGNSGMSCGGSGDVLSGMIASFVTQGIAPLEAALLGVNIHGKAGDSAARKYSMNYMLPSDIIGELSGIFLKQTDMKKKGTLN